MVTMTDKSELTQQKTEPSLDTVFQALSDPTRRSILMSLTTGPKFVTDLTKHYDISAPALSRHLKVLEAAGLIEREIMGTWRKMSLNHQALSPAAQWISMLQT